MTLDLFIDVLLLTVVIAALYVAAGELWAWFARRRMP